MKMTLFVIGNIVTIRVALYGVGSIGQSIARALLKRRGYEIVAAIDIDSSKVGKDLGELIGSKPIGVSITSDIDELYVSAPDVVIHTTASYLDKVYDQLVNSILARAYVVSTCETLSYPWYRYPVLARRLDRLAQTMGVAVIGTGINPGFLLDTLVAVMTLPLQEVKSVKVTRSLDASKRRVPFQKKIGIGMNPEELREKLHRGELTGHVGYAESVCLIADALGIQPTKIEEGQEPVIASETIEIGGIKVQKGKALGVRGWGKGFIDDKSVIEVNFVAYVGAEEYEEIVIEGDQVIKWRSTGTHGDKGTTGVIINIIPLVMELQPGLYTMSDLIPSYRELYR